jgi:1-deoxy-D-xylulose-5-phosphate reductoisomerase
VLNAANEVAVQAFLTGAIRFDQIHTVNAQTLDKVPPEPESADSVEALLELDMRSRRCADRCVGSLAP